MRRTITPLELRRSLGEILDRVALRQDEFVVARRGKPLAAVVPVQVLDAMRQAARLRLAETLDRAGSTDLTEAEADALADEAKHATRPH
jgi:prevent-host-death family protein